MDNNNMTDLLHPEVDALNRAEARDAALKEGLTGQELTDCMDSPDVFALNRAEKLDAPAQEARRKQFFRIKTYLQLRAISDSLRGKMSEIMDNARNAANEERKVA